MHVMKKGVQNQASAEVHRTSDLSLFPCWQRFQGHPNLPVFYRRVLFASPCGRSVHALLSLVGDQCRVSITLEEQNQKPLLIVTKGAEGIGSLARGMNWAEWVVSDYEALCELSKRSRKGSKRVSTRNIPEAA